MEKFNTIISTAIPLDVDNVDTDMIIPAQYLKSVSKNGYGQNLFAALRALYPDFIFNHPLYQNRQILLSKTNFGCGSSREHAVWALTQYGIKAVICSSFSDIFFSNAAKNGLLLIKMPAELVNSWIARALQDPSLVITIDLLQQTIIVDSHTQYFAYDPYSKYCLMNGLEDLDYLLSCKSDIEAYETRYLESNQC